MCIGQRNPLHSFSQMILHCKMNNDDVGLTIKYGGASIKTQSSLKMSLGVVECWFNLSAKVCFKSLPLPPNVSPLKEMWFRLALD